MFPLQGVPKLFFLVLDMTPIHHVDSMGLHFLEDLVFSTRAKGIELILCNPNHNVWRAGTCGEQAGCFIPTGAE